MTTEGKGLRLSGASGPTDRDLGEGAGTGQGAPARPRPPRPRTPLSFLPQPRSTPRKHKECSSDLRSDPPTVRPESAPKRDRPSSKIQGHISHEREPDQHCLRSTTCQVTSFHNPHQILATTRHPHSRAGSGQFRAVPVLPRHPSASACPVLRAAPGPSTSDSVPVGPVSAGYVELGPWAGAFPSELCDPHLPPIKLPVQHSHHSCWASFSRPQWSFTAHEHTPL